MSIWGILVRYPNGVFNINESYKTYEKAKAVIKYKRIEPENLKIIDDYKFYDLENEILYEIKSIWFEEE